MSKKKLNPSKIPISSDSFNVKEILAQSTRDMLLRGWALVLGALASSRETTSEDLIKLWTTANEHSNVLSGHKDVEKELEYVEKAIGISIPHETISSSNIKTQGDLNKFIRRVNHKALNTSLVLIAEPIVSEKLYSEENIRFIFQKALSLDEDIQQRRISLTDIQEMLLDEYKLYLFQENGRIGLFTIGEKPVERTVEELPSLDKLIQAAATKTPSDVITVKEKEINTLGDEHRDRQKSGRCV